LFWIIRFILEWLIWLILADKKRWREIFPVSFFSGLIAGTTDIIVNHYRLWQYDDHTSMIPELVNTWGMYVVIVYLFIQWLPKQKTFWRMIGYWFFWTGAMITVEWIHAYTGHITYPLWWKIYHSYIADWILFAVFYQYYKIFHFEKLSK
jgi:hypothetical protein